MRRESYDVIIAGAGPAGAQCARYLTENSKYSVLLLDRTQEIGEPKKSTAGTRPETFAEFALPRKTIMCMTPHSILEGPTKEVVIPTPGWGVLDFGQLKKFLVEQAVHHGADLRIGSTVTKPLLKEGKITGVEYRDADGVHTATAKIVIDATGPCAVLTTQLGLHTPDAHDHAVGMEYEMERLQLKQQNVMLIKFDHTYAPGGYSWIFSTGHNHAKVGNCWNSRLFTKMGGMGSSLHYLERWMQEDKRLLSGIATEMHAGDAFLEADVSSRSADNFLAIGDTVAGIHPLFGEGIYPAMSMGSSAAAVVIQALQHHDTAARTLSAFDKDWQQGLGKHRRIAYFLMNRLYGLPNTGFDKVVDIFKRLDHATLQRFMQYEFTLKDVAKLIPTISAAKIFSGPSTYHTAKIAPIANNTAR